MLPALGRRWAVGALAGLLLSLPAPAPAHVSGTPADRAAPASAPPPGKGPAMLTPAAARARSVVCSGDLDRAPRPPVLLVPGTSLTPLENWAPTYLPVLLERGHAVCLVSLPAYATRDVQANVEYVASALHTMARRSTRKVSTIGHSQGAFLPHAALRTWPGLAAHVDDVIGLAGVYDRGSTELVRRCAARCVPALHQLATGSAYLRHLAQRALPAGPSYSNIGARGDLTVTPQPAANEQPGATSLIVQAVCPGHEIPEPEHAMIGGDAVALALTLDALDHPGAAAPGRIDPATCDQHQYGEFDPESFLTVPSSRASRLATPVTHEPPLWCRHRPGCRLPRLRGFVLDRPRYSVGPGRVAVHAEVLRPGRVRVVLGRRAVARWAPAGKVTLSLPRPDRPSRLVVQTRPRFYTAWGTETRRWVPR